MFCVTPIAGALLVWLTFLAARALAGPLAGAMAAVLIATSPMVLYQVVQPMNDITTAALWMATFVALIHRHDWGAAGVCCGVALLVRPNLLPLAVVAGFCRVGSLESGAERLRFGLAVSVRTTGFVAERRAVWQSVSDRIRSARTPVQRVRDSAERVALFAGLSKPTRRFRCWRSPRRWSSRVKNEQRSRWHSA